MRKLLLALVTAFAATAAAPAASGAQAAETYEQLVSDPSLTPDHAIVVRLYQAVFDRQGDPEGVRFWLDSFDSGDWTTRRIAGFFATSDEFVSTYGETDDVAFMTAVYTNVLGRAPDAEGGAYWTGQLAEGMSRAEMILLISNAPEFVDANLIPADNQAESGLRFDYGEIERVETVGDVTWIWFDRWTFATLQGTELTEEPRWEMATDWHGGGNVNPRQRRYPLASEATVLEIDPVDFVEACGDLDLPWAFVQTDIETLAGHASLASLTFNADGEVTLARDQRGC